MKAVIITIISSWIRVILISYLNIMVNDQDQNQFFSLRPFEVSLYKQNILLSTIQTGK